MLEILNYVNELMTKLNLDYEFGEWKNETVPQTYWVGEYNQTGSSDDTSDEMTFILTGTSFISRFELEREKEIIKEKLKDGLTTILKNNSGIAIIYNNGFGIPSAVEGIHRYQINLKIKEWRSN